MKAILITVFLVSLLSCGMLLHAANGNKIKLFKTEKMKAVKTTVINEMDFLPNIFLR